LTLCHFLCHCQGMKALEGPRNPDPAGRGVKHRAAQYRTVTDGRKQRIRGLWIRGSRFYARLNVADPLTGEIKTRRIPLLDKEGKPVQSVAQHLSWSTQQKICYWQRWLRERFAGGFHRLFRKASKIFFVKWLLAHFL